MERLDAISDQFRYDPKVARYRWRKGTPGAGQLVSKKVIETMLDKQIDRLGDDLVKTADKLPTVNGKVQAQGAALRQWQVEAAGILKQLTGSVAVLAHGGHGNMTDDDWLAVGRRLKEQYYSGTYTNPATGKTKRFGLQLLARELKQGKISPAQLKQRLGMYASGAIGSYWDAADRANAKIGKLYCYRTTTPGEICPDCIAHEKLGILPVAKIPRIGQSRCGPNCRCRKHYLTLAEAVKRGYQVA